MNQRYLQRIMSGEGGSAAAMVRLGLSLASPAYGLIVAGRNQLFDTGIRRSVELGRPTVSVGNITTGGTGKTPMVLYLARQLQAMGGSPAVLTRGYHGGDEARQMQTELGPGVPVEVNPDRAAGARAVLARQPQTQVFILDDGFQHRQVTRDLDLVLIDATDPFGLGHLLPRGLLREPIGALRRADAVILTRIEQVTADEIASLDRRITDITGQPPVAYAAMAWSAVRHEDEQHSVDALKRLRVIGVCGIGNPSPFEGALRKASAEVVDVYRFADHHLYTAADRERLEQAAADARADALVMTEKDWVKWSALEGRSADAAVRPVYRPVLQLEFDRGSDRLHALLRDRLHLSVSQEHS